MNLGSVDKDFEINYRYDGKLGALYTKEKTTFRLFSPLASSVFVSILTVDKRKILVTMNRLPQGVYEAVVEEDLECASYTYIAKINGEYVEAPDPYSFSLSSNSTKSYVVNLNKVKEHCADKPNNREKLKRYTDAILYELSVSSLSSNNLQYGSFGLVEYEPSGQKKNFGSYPQL